MLNCGSPQLMASGGGGVGYWELDHAPVSIWAAQIGLTVFCLFACLFLFFFFFEVGGHRVGVKTWEV